MSLKLYNAVKFKETKIDVLFEQLMELKIKVLNKFLEKLDEKFILELTEEYYKKFNKKPKCFELIRFIKYELSNIDNYQLNSLQYSICIFPYKGKLYGIPFGDYNKVYDNFLNEISYDFSYWNNTDKPDELTNREWNKRRNVWTSIIDNGMEFNLYKFKDLSLNYDLFTESDIDSNLILFIKKLEILNNEKDESL